MNDLNVQKSVEIRGFFDNCNMGCSEEPVLPHVWESHPNINDNKSEQNKSRKNAAMLLENSYSESTTQVFRHLIISMQHIGQNNASFAKALSHFLDVVFSKTFFVGICREKKFSKIQHLRCETGPLISCTTGTDWHHSMNYAFSCMNYGF